MHQDSTPSDKRALNSYVSTELRRPILDDLIGKCIQRALGTAEPFAEICRYSKTFHQTTPLSPQEVVNLYPLLLEVAGQQPQSKYKELLRQLQTVRAEFARHYLLFRLGLSPHKKLQHRFEKFIQDARSISPLIRRDGRVITSLDLSKQNPRFAQPNAYLQLDQLTTSIDNLLSEQNAQLGIGGYLEERPFYSTEHFTGPRLSGVRPRDLHLGLDLWSAAGETIYAPLPGKIHSFRQNDNPRDYGATIILEHQPTDFEEPLRFFTLYGHLSSASLETVHVGQPIYQGQAFATTGVPAENGGWPPHLHFQIMLDLFGWEGDFPGVGVVEDRDFWSSYCPDPSTLAVLT